MTTVKGPRACTRRGRRCPLAPPQPLRRVRHSANAHERAWGALAQASLHSQVTNLHRTLSTRRPPGGHGGHPSPGERVPPHPPRRGRDPHPRASPPTRSPPALPTPATAQVQTAAPRGSPRPGTLGERMRGARRARRGAVGEGSPARTPHARPPSRALPLAPAGPGWLGSGLLAARVSPPEAHRPGARGGVEGPVAPAACRSPLAAAGSTTRTRPPPAPLSHGSPGPAHQSHLPPPSPPR